MENKTLKRKIVFSIITFLAMQSCTTTRDFSSGLDKDILKQGYIYQRASKTEQLSIKFHDDKNFTCRRASYQPKYEGMDWGGGQYQTTEDGLILTNKDCRLDPEFTILKCVLKRKYGIGVQYIWNCENERTQEYVFWMIDK